MRVFEAFDNRDVPLQTLGAVMASAMVALLVAAGYHQLVASRDYRQDESRQSFRTVRVPAPRGSILDRNGTPLAVNTPDYQLHLYLNDLRPYFSSRYDQIRPKRPLVKGEKTKLSEQAREDVVREVVRHASAAIEVNIQLDSGTIRRHYSAELPMPIVLASELTFEQIARFEERASHIPGLELETARHREYPMGTLAAHAIGYVRRNDESRANEPASYNYRLPDYSAATNGSGIERAFDAVLSGDAAERSVRINNLGYRESVYDSTEPVPGRDVVLTLDARLQARAEESLRDRRGAILLMDARTGDLLVLASAPAFDPNVFTAPIPTQTWTSLTNEYFRPLINRATAGIYAPGSIFKIVSGLACLENGLNPAETLSLGVYFELPGGRRIKNGAAPGDYDFRRAFLKSSNGYFVHHTRALGNNDWEALDRLNQIAEQFHLGKRIDIPVGQGASGDYPTREWIRSNRGGWTSGDMANLSFGQGDIAVTPLQMLVMTAAVANGGQVLQPRIVHRIEGGGSPVAPGTTLDHLRVSARSLQVIRNAMLSDVTAPDGTGRAAAIDGMTIGGKTGTAEKQNKSGGHIGDTTWFASFAETPQRLYALIVMVEDGQSGGETCAPIARKVFERIRELESSGSLALNGGIR